MYIPQQNYYNNYYYYNQPIYSQVCNDKPEKPIKTKSKVVKAKNNNRVARLILDPPPLNVNKEDNAKDAGNEKIPVQQEKKADDQNKLFTGVKELDEIFKICKHTPNLDIVRRGNICGITFNIKTNKIEFV